MECANVSVKSTFEHQSKCFIDFLASNNPILNPIVKEAVSALLAKHQWETAALVLLRDMDEIVAVAVYAAYALAGHSVLVLTPTKREAKIMKVAYIGRPSGAHFSYLVENNFFTPETFRQQIAPSWLVAKNVDDLRSPNSLIIKVCDEAIIDRYPRDQFDLIIIVAAEMFPPTYWRIFLEHFPSSRRVILSTVNTMHIPACFVNPQL